MPQQQQRIVTLKTARLVTALVSEIECLTLPPDQRPELPTLSFKDGRTDIKILPSDLLPYLGKTRKLGSREGGMIRVAIPSLSEALQFLNTTSTSANREVVTFIDDACRGKSAPPGGDPAVGTSELVLRAFEALPDAEQGRMMKHLRRLIAHYAAFAKLTPMHRDEILARQQDPNALRREALLQELDLGPINPAESVTPAENDVERLRRMEFLLRSNAGVLGNFLAIIDAFHWEETVAPRKHIEEFLPNGIRMDDPVSKDSPIGRSAPGDVTVTGDESKIDPARFSFYTDKLGCKKVVRAVGALAKYGYCAFLLRAASKQPYALLDSPAIENAVYVFRMDAAAMPDDSPWVPESQKTKSEVIATREEGGPFIRRVWHSGDWQDRVKRFLDEN